MNKISFIIPVYNTESYLKRCVESLLNQNLSSQDYEIIIVDNGSTDKSYSVAQVLASDNDNVFLYRKGSGGANGARNYGLTKAKGKYIWFIDSDDAIIQNCLSGVIKFMEDNNVDYLDFPISEIYENKTILANSNKKPKEIVSSIEWVNKYEIKFSPCSFVSKRTIWTENDIRFSIGMVLDDYDIILRLLQFCETCGHYNEHKGLYNYFKGREGSISTDKSLDKDIKVLESWINIITILKISFPSTKTSNYSLGVQRYISLFSYILLNRLLMIDLSFSEKEKFLSIVKEKQLLPKTQPVFYPRKINKILNFMFTSFSKFRMLTFLIRPIAVYKDRKSKK